MLSDTTHGQYALCGYIRPSIRGYVRFYYFTYKELTWNRYTTCIPRQYDRCFICWTYVYYD